jgi:hypothetical protein
MEQPGAVVLRLEKVTDAINEYEDYQSKKASRRVDGSSRERDAFGSTGAEPG